MWSIVLYETEHGKNPVKDFLSGLPDKQLAKVLRDIDLLRREGIALSMPQARQIEGKLWELRTKFSSDITRIFYFVFMGNEIVLLHGFAKKTQKTPPNEIEKAKRYMKDHQRRKGNEI